jgi:hypothetical protein
MDKGKSSAGCKESREAEAAEHAELWKSNSFRKAVKRHEAKGDRKATAKR